MTNQTSERSHVYRKIMMFVENTTPAGVEHFNLKEFLDEKVLKYNQLFFIEADPIQVPKNFSGKENIEIAAFLTATIAWGNRLSIIKNATKLMSLLDNQPHDFVLNASNSDLKNIEHFVHRTFNGSDCVYFIRSLRNIYQNHNGLQTVFERVFSLPSESTGGFPRATNSFRAKFGFFRAADDEARHIFTELCLMHFRFRKRLLDCDADKNCRLSSLSFSFYTDKNPRRTSPLPPWILEAADSIKARHPKLFESEESSVEVQPSGVNTLLPLITTDMLSVLILTVNFLVPKTWFGLHASCWNGGRVFST